MKQFAFSKLHRFALGTLVLATIAACGGGSSAPESGSSVAGVVAQDSAPSATASHEPLPESAISNELLRDEVNSGAEVNASGPSERIMASAVATPRVAALTMGTQWQSASYQSQLARYNVAIVSIPATASGAEMDAAVNSLKAKNPGLLLGQFTTLTDIDERQADIKAAADTNKWWLKNTTGQRFQTTGRTFSFDTNITAWAPKDSSQLQWPQWKGTRDYNVFFKNRGGLDFVFTDSVYPQRVSADWQLNGSNQSWSDATIDQAVRTGFSNYWDQLRKINPNIKVVPNVWGNWMAAGAFAGKMNGAFLNGLIGKSWSPESVEGWLPMMARYRAAMANTVAPKAVIFNVIGSATDYRTMRFGLASSLLDNGYYSYSAMDGTDPAPWMDEFSTPIGDAAEAPPSAAAPSGIWVRRYTNGMALVNPSKTNSATITIEAGYRRIGGTQDPITNNGAVASTVTLGPRDGLILVKDAAPVSNSPAPSPSTTTTFDKPKTYGLAYGTSVKDTAVQAAVSRYSAVLLGMWGGLAGMDTIVNNIKAKNPSILVGNYTIIGEARDNTAAATAINANNWWLKDASGNRVQWTSAYGAWEVNITKWNQMDSLGRTYAEWKADYDQANIFSKAKIDWLYADTVQMSWVTADWQRIGVNQDRTNAISQQGVREGHARHWARMRQLNPNLKVVANIAPSWLGTTEVNGKLDGAYMEAMIGKSWSPETSDWNGMRQRYYDGFKYVSGPKWVFFNMYANATDYKSVRFGLASSMLNDGYFGACTLSVVSIWIDEFDARIGKPIEAAPTAATANGIWTRKYENGIVLVNPNKTNSASISLPAGYKRLTGAQDPSVNSGGAATAVTLGPREGLLLVKS